MSSHPQQMPVMEVGEIKGKFITLHTLIKQNCDLIYRPSKYDHYSNVKFGMMEKYYFLPCQKQKHCHDILIFPGFL